MLARIRIDPDPSGDVWLRMRPDVPAFCSLNSVAGVSLCLSIEDAEHIATGLEQVARAIRDVRAIGDTRAEEVPA